MLDFSLLEFTQVDLFVNVFSGTLRHSLGFSSSEGLDIFQLFLLCSLECWICHYYRQKVQIKLLEQIQPH